MIFCTEKSQNDLPFPVLSLTEQRKGWKMRQVRAGGWLRMKYWRWLLHKAGRAHRWLTNGLSRDHRRHTSPGACAPRQLGQDAQKDSGGSSRGYGLPSCAAAKAPRPSLPPQMRSCRSVRSSHLLQQTRFIPCPPSLGRGRLRRQS